MTVLGACSSSDEEGGPDGGSLFVSEAGLLSVDSTDPVRVFGPVGGPFTPAETVLELSNVGGLELDWTAESSEAWLVVSSGAGSLAAADTFDLSVTVNQTLAATFPESERLARVTISQVDDEETEFVIGFTLDVGESWSVEDQSTFYTSGPVGGPFNPASRTYTVTNNFHTMLSWGVLSSAAWVTTNTNGGMLAPGDSAEVVASINQGSAASLESGVHDAALTFSADLDTDSIVRTVRLTANAPSGDLEAVITTPGNTMKIAPFSTMFSGLDSVEDGEEIVRWLWDFGDDNSSDARTDEGMLVGHRFDTADTYTVTLTVIDAAGASDSVTTQVVVVPFGGMTFYVSESTGSDSNIGNTPSAPFKTLEYAVDNMGGFQGNPNRLLLMRGDTWTESSSLSTKAPSIIGAYGSGA
ncbi:MAG: PKD domain-containing protein, partial [Planctomycetota bacterium]|nr:PKD domain-containing protein [Planctomycetota bacterium]